mgnify:CR=1 FL=1
MKQPISYIAGAMMALFLNGCGFKAIYATPENGAAPLNQLVAIGDVRAPESVQTLIADALHDRIYLQDGESPKYELTVEATESAQRLAVQIDATVTRYNYRLNGKYTLVDLETGKAVKGSARAVASYNIVPSQYSTLFAERTAQEKAARILAEDIERELLIRFSDGSLTPESNPPENEDGAGFEGDYDKLNEPDEDVELIEDVWRNAE